jgi:CII-binding regulator of phage lambda lysogenization HflD
MNLEERLKRCEEVSDVLERRVRTIEKMLSRFDADWNVIEDEKE